MRSKWGWWLLAAGFLGLVAASRPAAASTDGILVIGTQSEVREILKDTDVHLIFSEENPNAMVAVRLTDNKVAVYENGPVQTIIQFIGKVVEGGMVLTIEAGSDLWNLLYETAHVVVQTGVEAAHAVCWVLRHGTVLVIDGVTWTVCTTYDCLQAAADFVRNIFHPNF
jgi:hypothetical protein